MVKSRLVKKNMRGAVTCETITFNIMKQTDPENIAAAPLPRTLLLFCGKFGRETVVLIV